MCAKHKAGCENAIHVMHTIFEDENIEAVLLDDAANASNSIKREVFFNNIFTICPAIFTYVRRNLSHVHNTLLFTLEGS